MASTDPFGGYKPASSFSCCLWGDLTSLPIDKYCIAKYVIVLGAGELENLWEHPFTWARKWGYEHDRESIAKAHANQELTLLPSLFM